MQDFSPHILADRLDKAFAVQHGRLLNAGDQSQILGAHLSTLDRGKGGLRPVPQRS